MSVRREAVVAGVTRTHPELTERVVRWAADEASARGFALRILHAQEWPRGAPPDAAPGHPAHAWSTHFRAAGQALLDDACGTAAAAHPGLPVTGELAVGRAAPVLRDAAETAALLVLGARRLTGVEGVFFDRGKGHMLVGHVPCPLALVPQAPAAPADGPVVVGVDGSDSSLAAVELAFAEADAAKTELVAVEVRRPRDAAWPEFIEETGLHLSELLAGHAERYPDTAVRYEILSGDPAPLLASAARHARCLVVGSRGRGGFRGMLLGSTSRDLVNRTACPLLVAPSGAV
jgi:nucleotide-binding universal stress UspA family protein